MDVGRTLSTHQLPGLISMFNAMSTDTVFKDLSQETALWAAGHGEWQFSRWVGQTLIKVMANGKWD